MAYTGNAKNTYQRDWLMRRRLAYLKDKVCVCGSSINLEIHHIDPTKKWTHNVWSYSADRREAELAKCVVLCHACHKATHGAYKCGTYASYNVRKCRCNECKAFERQRKARYRSRKHKKPEIANVVNAPKVADVVNASV